MDHTDVLEQLALTWRLCGELGLVDGVLNHCSVRLPNESGLRLAVTPGHLLAKNVSRSDLSIVDFGGSKGSAKDHPPGLMLHGCVLQSRPDVSCVIHLHSSHATAVSCHTEGLLPLTQTSLEFCYELAYVDYSGPASSFVEASRIATELGGASCAMLRNHGVLIVGSTVAEAFYRAYYLEEACRLQLVAMSSNGAQVIPSAIAREAAQHLLIHQRQVAPLFWQALARNLMSRPEGSFGQAGAQLQ